MSFLPTYRVSKHSKDATKKFALQDIIRNNPQDGIKYNRGKTTNEAVESYRTLKCA